MPRLTTVQVAQVCSQAGFRGSGLTKAVAVAMAESRGDTQAVGTNLDTYRSHDRGLFQINDHWHPEVTDAQAFDPLANAQAAYQISKAGADWSQWATWPIAATAEVPLARVAIAQAARRGTVVNAAAIPDPDDLLHGLGEGLGGILGDDNPLPGIPNPLGAIKGTEEALTAIGGSVISVGAWVADPHNWFRVGLFVAGGLGLMVAVTMIGKSGAAGEGVARATTQATGAVKDAALLAATKGKV